MKFCSFLKRNRFKNRTRKNSIIMLIVNSSNGGSSLTICVCSMWVRDATPAGLFQFKFALINLTSIHMHSDAAPSLCVY